MAEEVGAEEAGAAWEPGGLGITVTIHFLILCVFVCVCTHIWRSTDSLQE